MTQAEHAPGDIIAFVHDDSTDRGVRITPTEDANLTLKPEAQITSSLQSRIDYALGMLTFIIGGSGKWKERDFEIEQVIRVLEGKTP
jgi:hypothetical protein